jgi:hypothetical protein
MTIIVKYETWNSKFHFILTYFRPWIENLDYSWNNYYVKNFNKYWIYYIVKIFYYLESIKFDLNKVK